MNLDFTVLMPYGESILKGTWITFYASVSALMLGCVLGLIFGLGRISSNYLFHCISSAYVQLIRGTPLLVQLYLLYQGLPDLGIKLPAIAAGVLALGINSGGYVAEIIRAGISSVPKGQLEAARSLGFSYVKAMRFVVLPQAIRNIIPPLGNEFISLVKGSSLLSVLAIPELTQAGQLIRADTYASFEAYIAIAVIYFVLTTILASTLTILQRKLNRPGAEVKA